MQRLPETLAPPPLQRSVLAAGAGSIAHALGQFLILYAVATITDAAEVGRYAFALAVTAPIFILCDLKLRIVLVSDAGSSTPTGAYTALRLVTIGMALTAVVAGAFIVSGEPRTRWAILAVAAFKAAESANDILFGVLQRRHQMALIARSQVVRAVVSVVVMTAALLVWHRIEVAVGLAAILMLGLAYASYRQVTNVAGDARPRFRPAGRLVGLARLALPVGLSVALGSMWMNVPRYFIQGRLGPAELGVYSVLLYGVVALGLVAQSVADTMMPRLADLHVRGEVALLRASVRRLVLFGGGLGIVGIAGAALIGRPVVSLIFGPVYAAQSRVLVLLMIGGALQITTLFYGVGINAMRAFKVELPVTILGLLSVALLTPLLIGTGLTGVATAVVASQALMALGFAVVYHRVARHEGR